ncbi:MAG: lipid-A-disaccharide synthase [Kiritimatiellae bacterium]|nr:lipid-A-disaccharide synthase [Kiritimatiellia bacterium]
MNKQQKTRSKILLLAGEESGVLYANRLAKLLRSSGAEIRGYEDYGFEVSDLAVMGFWPVLRKIRYFLGVARTIKRAISEWRPDVVVTVDYPGLNLKLAAYAKKRGIPAVHMVCPQVWAWHQGRIPKVAASLTKLLCFFPFEPGLFAGTSLDAKFIGHPLVNVVEREKSEAGMDCDIGRKRRIALLPGSRIGEIQRILPRLLESVKILMNDEDSGRRLGNLEICIPAANEAAEREIRNIMAGFESIPCVEIQKGGARDVLRKADCAAVASGTATLEAALLRCPTVLVYAVGPVLAWFAKRVIKGVKHVGLANVVAEKSGFEPPMPELLQEAFTPCAVAQQLKAWLLDDAARKDAADKLDKAMGYLKADGEPFEIAANEILGCLDKEFQDERI